MDSIQFDPFESPWRPVAGPVARPDDFQVQIPMFPIPMKPKPLQLSAFAKKKKPVLLVFYRAHW